MVYLPPEILLLIMSFGGEEVVNLVNDDVLLEEINDYCPDFQLSVYLEQRNRIRRGISSTTIELFNLITLCDFFNLYRSCNDWSLLVIVSSFPLPDYVPMIGTVDRCPMPGYTYSSMIPYDAKLMEHIGLLAQLEPLERRKPISLYRIVHACWRNEPIGLYLTSREEFMYHDGQFRLS